jgi:hypothetical protein
MDRLTLSFFFTRNCSKDYESAPHVLFTTLLRDLCTLHPLFKKTIGEVIRADTYIRLGAPGCRPYFDLLVKAMQVFTL